MPSLTNINLLGELKELIPQYIETYLITNVAGDAVFKVDSVSLQEWSGSPKSLINVYDYRVEDNPQGSGICREQLLVYFTVGIRKLEKAPVNYDLQAGYIRAIFSGKGVSLNPFSGKFNGSSFTNLRLSDFGLYDFRLSAMREQYSQNATYWLFSVQCKVNFSNVFNPIA
jgi:hypothetical protein